MWLQPGYHLNIAASAYRGDPCERPSLSASLAKVLLRESPFKAKHLHPRLHAVFADESDEKFDIGTAAHALLLEGDDIMHVVAAEDWRTKAAKEERDAARQAGKIPMLSRQARAVKRMVNAARDFIAASPFAGDWENAQSEVTGVVEDGGTLLRCRFDRITKSRALIFDYKTTDDASPSAFSRQITRMGYQIQEAFYRHVAMLLGSSRPDFLFLAQSVEPPHECSWHGCAPGLREVADAEVKRAIAIWKKCVTTGEWPSHGTDVHWAECPNWMLVEHEMRILEAA